jgi:putative SOS response-associated peptidase YedK
MCGRYTLKADGRSVAKLFDLAGESREFEIEPRYNIAPTQRVAVVLEDDARERELRMMRWGLIPFWADDPGIGSRMINARAEKPSYRSAFKRRRCLIPADGFYEWKKEEGGKLATSFRLPLHRCFDDRLHDGIRKTSLSNLRPCDQILKDLLPDESWPRHPNVPLLTTEDNQY